MRTRRCINGRTLETGANHLEGSLDSFDAKAEGLAIIRPRRSQKPRLTGEGDFVSTCNPSKPSEECKGRSPIPLPKFHRGRRSPPRRFGPPTPEEKAHRLAVLRAVLADSAPEFQARIDAGERGEQP